MDIDLNAANEEQLRVEESDDSCFFDTVPLAGDTVGSCTAECVSGNVLGEVDPADLKQEPDDVCCVLRLVSVYHSKEFVQILGNFRSLVTKFSSCYLGLCASMVYALLLSSLICLPVRHKPVLCPNGET